MSFLRALRGFVVNNSDRSLKSLKSLAMNTVRFFFTATLAMSLFFAAGCASETSTTPPPRHSALTDADLAGLGVVPGAPASGQPVGSVEQAVGSDPCAIRLGEIQDALVRYYAARRELPQQLQFLWAENGTGLQLACPKSGHLYSYSREGLVNPGRTMRIIVWDDAPVHDGYRWCILMAISPSGGLALDIKPLPEAVFKTYIKPVEN